MKTKFKKKIAKSAATFIFVFLSLIILADNISPEKVGLGLEEVEILKSKLNELSVDKNSPRKLYLRKAVGHLNIIGCATTDTYEAYFHIPIPFQEQVPILIEIESSQLIDYRFIHLNPPNVIIAAHMKQAPNTSLNWTAWVLIKENRYADLPSSVPFPALKKIPDHVKKWLAPTDCAQSSATLVQETAASIRGSTKNIMKLAEDISAYCENIPWEFPHSPPAFDAVYTLKWGNSCTGHGHAAAALFRANGVPARSLLNIPVWFNGYMDMHWIVDYYVPDYGWVRQESSIGQNPVYPSTEIVTFASNPEDEFCLFFPMAIDGCWHTSDPELGMWNPDWSRAHRAFIEKDISAPPDKIEEAHHLTNLVFSQYSRYWGIKLTQAQQEIFQEAYSYQLSALKDLQYFQCQSYIVNMRKAYNCYKNINPEPITFIFHDDFENSSNVWSHGGYQDEWELGTPTYGVTKSHSGDNCWGIDLDNTYENNADCWLMSPPIDLSNKACAYLSFWVWNSVQDQYGYVFDPLWLDITKDGTTFYPLCSKMGGVNDDPEIPDIGGWSRVVLDLTKYAGETVQIRFRFQSDGDTVWPGPYIDDVHVYGRNSTPESPNI